MASCLDCANPACPCGGWYTDPPPDEPKTLERKVCDEHGPMTRVPDTSYEMSRAGIWWACDQCEAVDITPGPLLLDLLEKGFTLSAEYRSRPK